MPRFAANLSTLFNEVPFPKRFAAASAAGFTAVEFLFPYAYPAEDLAAALKSNNLTQALFNQAYPPRGASGGEERRLYPY